MSRTLTVASIVVAAFCAYAGAMKLVHPDLFSHWGVSDLVLGVAGVAEITAAILVVVPAARFPGSLGLAVLMVVAMIAHVSGGRPSLLPVSVVILAILARIAWHSRPRHSWVKPQRS